MLTIPRVYPADRPTIRSVSKARDHVERVVLVVGLAVRWNRGGRRLAARAFVASAAATLVVGVVVGALTYFAFDSLFLFFHQMTFHNDFWELDPRTDRLIQMFPFGFW